jgi:T5orf172 domain-containing protein
MSSSAPSLSPATDPAMLRRKGGRPCRPDDANEASYLLPAKAHESQFAKFRMTRGFVYILINPALPGYLKIGKTTRTPEERAKDCGGLRPSFRAARLR